MLLSRFGLSALRPATIQRHTSHIEALKRSFNSFALHEGRCLNSTVSQPRCARNTPLRVRKWPWPSSRAGFYSISRQTPEETNTSSVEAHLVATSLHINGVRETLTSMGAKVSQHDGLTLVEECAQLGHDHGPVFIHNNGSIVLWHAATSSFEAYKEVLQKHVMIPLKFPPSAVSEFSESIDVREADSNCVVKGVLHLDRNHTIAEQTAVSLALMSAVLLNFVELDIRRRIMVSKAELDRLRRNLSRRNLDRLTERLFEYQTFAHETRYGLNLEHDLLELPDTLWEDEDLCALFRAAQATFDMPQRLEKLNHRISWELEALQSHSEYVRHKHSSRLEKIIIAVITLELALALLQVLLKLA